MRTRRDLVGNDLIVNKAIDHVEKSGRFTEESDCAISRLLSVLGLIELKDVKRISALSVAVRYASPNSHVEKAAVSEFDKWMQGLKSGKVKLRNSANIELRADYESSRTLAGNHENDTIRDGLRSKIDRRILDVPWRRSVPFST